MAYIDLTFDEINNSMEVGDVVYYTNTTTSDGFEVSSNTIVQVGTIESITTDTNQYLNDGETDNPTYNKKIVVVDCESDLTPPTTNDFIFFSKNNVINVSAVKGYYSLIEFKNNSTSATEMFSVGCDISESSK
tara:strand:+ start:11115 stop:11513 length:399 start_codon:yes stop_codon:yes gene_type:complete